MSTKQITSKSKNQKKKKKRKKKANQLRAQMEKYDEQVFSHPSSTQATTVLTLRQNTLEKAVVTPLPSPSKRIQVRFEHVKPKTLIMQHVAQTRRGGKNKRRKTRKKRRKKTRKKRKRRKTRKRKRRRRGGGGRGLLEDVCEADVKQHKMFDDCCGLEKAQLEAEKNEIAERLREYQNAERDRRQQQQQHQQQQQPQRQHQDNRRLFNHF